MSKLGAAWLWVKTNIRAVLLGLGALVAALATYFGLNWRTEKRRRESAEAQKEAEGFKGKAEEAKDIADAAGTLIIKHESSAHEIAERLKEEAHKHKELRLQSEKDHADELAKKFNDAGF